MSPILFFGLESVPDVAGIRLLYDLPLELSDFEVGEYALQRRRAESDADALPASLQRVVCLSAILLRGTEVSLYSFAEPLADEAGVLAQFFDLFEQNRPRCVVWEGAASIFPVLNVRSLLHGIEAPAYWGSQAEVSAAEKPCELSRLLFGTAGGGATCSASQLASLSGCGGRQDVARAAVWDAWHSGAYAGIETACASDVLSVAMLFVRWQFVSGLRSETAWRNAVLALQAAVSDSDSPAWQRCGGGQAPQVSAGWS